ncbi:hypothetical protein IR083_20960 [Dysgonomonas sp. GY75]|uniref:hypothetical protein n=1 Tax=Dysgonomonas sp. GY75 TaxID=2780419 RepID=UPI001883C8CE|nr:hypothetical protein [Dysgonomonas sp. GY75]MBF0651293.1 hypothetical protein [Dysgonomonas sp. GY75]
MDNALIISQFSSLNFSEWKHHFEKQEAYWQVFSVLDEIKIQYSVKNDAVFTLTLKNTDTGEIIPLSPIIITGSVDFTTYLLEFPELDNGYYMLRFSNAYSDTVRYACFCKLNIDDLRLRDTVKFRYTNREDNFDAHFIKADGENRYFDFRIEGGFLYGEMIFDNESNGFRNQEYINTQLSAYPFEKHKLTLGTPKGVPIWAARKINLIYSLSEITVDGKTYIRSDGSAPEITQIIPSYPLYVIKIDVEPDDFYSERAPEFVPAYLITEDRKNWILTEDKHYIKLYG